MYLTLNTHYINIPILTQHTLLDAERNVAGGMMRAVLVMAKCKHLPPPDTPYNTEQQRFEQRFGCFAGVARPQPRVFSQWEAANRIARMREG